MRRRQPACGLVAVVALSILTTASCGTSVAPLHRSGHTTSTSSPPSSSAPPAPAAGRDGVPAVTHLFVVVMENLGASGALAVPQIAALAHRYQWTTSWYATSHPSLPNYLALVSGSTWGVTSDCTSCFQSGANLATQLDAAHVSWGAYFGAMPVPCFLGPQSPDGDYAQKHDPFAYFTDVRADPVRCRHLQPLGALTPLLAGPPDAVPRFVWVTPDMCDSGHDCGGATAGAWVASFVAQVTASAAWRNGGALVVTWDEGDTDAGLDPVTGTVRSGGGGGPVLTVVAAPGAPAGRMLPGPYDHYSLLRTVEDAFGLPLLGAAGAPGVRALGAFFSPASGSG